MKDFLKVLPYKQVIPLYIVMVFILSALGYQLNYGWQGFKFGLPFTLIILIVDLISTYRLYKKWEKN